MSNISPGRKSNFELENIINSDAAPFEDKEAAMVELFYREHLFRHSQKYRLAKQWSMLENIESRSGFPAKASVEFTLDELQPQEFMAICLDIFKKLKWRISYINEEKIIAYSSFSPISFGEKITVTIRDGIVEVCSKCSGLQYYDFGKNKRNVHRIFLHLFRRDASKDMDEMVAALEEKRSQYPAQNLSDKEAEELEDSNGLMSILMPRKGYFVTPIIILLNLLVYLVMVFSEVDIFMPSVPDLMAWGGNMKLLTLEGQWWRLVSNFFVHAGLFHLLVNMYVLFSLGLLLEPILGRARTFSAYFLSGIGGSLASLWYYDVVVSVGASGAIFGMFGVFLALLMTNFIDRSMRRGLLLSISILVAYSLFSGMQEGIDNAAHIGGLVTGIVIGIMYYPGLSRSSSEYKWGAISGSYVIVLLVAAAFIAFMPNYGKTYDTALDKFIKNEEVSLRLLDHQEYITTKGARLKELKRNGIKLWEENLKLLEDLENVNLPGHLQERNDLLLEYSELRLESFQLLYRAVEEETANYDNDLMVIDNQMEYLLRELQYYAYH